MKPNRHISSNIMVMILIFAMASTGFIYFSGSKLSKEIARGEEKELKVNIDAGMSDIVIGRSGPKILLTASADIDDDGENPAAGIEECLQYDVRDRVGYLDISTTGHKEKRHQRKSGISIEGLTSSDWNLYFTDAIPIAFDIEFGLGNGDIDLSGLAVKDLRLSTGASSVKLKFDKPNRETMEDLSIEAGLSKFRASGLGNANFNHLRFEGGVGSYRLDFSGELSHEADVDINVGLGAMTIILPPNIGAKIYFEKSWVAQLTIDKEFLEEEEDTYVSPNYASSKAKLNFNIEAGFGSVTVTRER